MRIVKNKGSAVACRAQELIYTNRIITHYCYKTNFYLKKIAMINTLYCGVKK